MKTRLAEQGTMFASVLKWASLASVVGVLVGYSTAFFLKALAYFTAEAGSSEYSPFALPAALFLSVFVARLLAKEAAGEGLDKVIDAVHNEYGKTRFRVAPAKFIASIITLAGGGSAGKEAPPVQVGGALASGLASLLKLEPSDRRKLVICSISAGFASVFGAPIAGAIFGMESLFLGQILYDVLFPSFVAGIVAYQVTLHLGVTYFTQEISVIPAFGGLAFLKVIIAGAAFGLISLLLIESMKYTERAFERLRLPEALKPVLAGLIILAGTLALGDRSCLGLGIPTIEGAVQGAHTPLYAPFVKMIFTALTLCSGASGGIITPIFFIGATSGSALGGLLGFDPATFAAIGMVAVLSGAANTPVSAGILAMEMFGVRLGPWAATAAVASYLIVGTRSIHGSQVIAALKSQSVQVPVRTKVGEATARIAVRDKSLTGLIRRLFR